MDDLAGCGCDGGHRVEDIVRWGGGADGGDQVLKR